MSMQGNLRDMSVADLIQHNCQEGRTARIEFKQAEGLPVAVLFLDQGQLVHAEMGGEQGEEVVYRVLEWGEGTFNLEPGVSPSARTISRSYAGILLEGMRRIDEASLEAASAAASPAAESPESEEGPMSAQVRDLKAIDGVVGVVIAARDGVVLAHEVEGDPEKEGAVAVFVGFAAAQVGQALALGDFEWGTVAVGKDTVLVVEQPDYYIGLMLDEKASPALVASKLESVLKG
jgi:predicted regulator of Ras-like GTPase activity (Roadblock/LC7/MglB family)